MTFAVKEVFLPDLTAFSPFLSLALPLGRAHPRVREKGKYTRHRASERERNLIFRLEIKMYNFYAKAPWARDSIQTARARESERERESGMTDEVRMKIPLSLEIPREDSLSLSLARSGSHGRCKTHFRGN